MEKHTARDMKLYCHAEYLRSYWPSLCSSFQLLPLVFSASASFGCGLQTILLWFKWNLFFFLKIVFQLGDGITKSTCSDCGLNVSCLIETCLSLRPLANFAPPAWYYWIRSCLPTRWPRFFFLFFFQGYASSVYVRLCMFIPGRSTACLHVGLIVLS